MNNKYSDSAQAQEINGVEPFEDYSGDAVSTYTPRKEWAFDPAAMFDDGGKGKALDIRDYVHSGKLSKTRRVLAWKITGKPYMDHANLERISEEIKGKYRATRIAREDSVDNIVEQAIELDGVNYRGNKVGLVVTTERGSDLSFCNRTLLSLWVTERWAEADEMPTIESKSSVLDGVVSTIKRLFGLAA